MTEHSCTTLDYLGILCLRGAGAKAYLQTQFTQDVDRLSCSQAVYGAVLTPHGKTVADIRAIQIDHETIWLIHDRSVSDALLQRLSRFALGHQVNFELLPSWIIQAGYGEVASAWADFDNCAPRLACQHVGNAIVLHQPDGAADAWRIAETGWQHDHPCHILSPADQEQRRIAAGIPRFAVDWFAGDYPLNANLREMDGISFEKGCYVGQEISSRMHWRGGIRHALYQVQLSAMPQGCPCDIHTTVVIGQLTSCTTVNGTVFGIARLPFTINDSQSTRLHADSRIALSPLKKLSLLS